MPRTALVVGGTGPTGPHVIDGLISRGYDVTVFHRGKHEPPELSLVEHIHGDPHFAETIADALGERSFDVAVAAYGRTKYLAAFLEGRVGKFISISGSPRYAGYSEPWRVTPSGPPIPAAETAALVTDLDASDSVAVRFGHKIVEAENAVFRHHPEGTVLVYPVVYGPRNLTPWEWSIIKRVQDGRKRIVLPDGGMSIHRRGAARNLAEFVLRVVDLPQVSAGQVYNCADDRQFSLLQWAELIADLLGAKIEVVGVPGHLVPMFKAIYIPNYQLVSDHLIFSTEKARTQLGYRDVLTPREALAESIEWYQANPVRDPEKIPGYHDRFNYVLEDQVAEAWLAAITRFGEMVQVPTPDDFHPMPHPAAPGLSADQRAR
jgi:nucleoside-diphosphate-sugar epimerase